MTNSLTINPSQFLLRACAAIATPPSREQSPEIVEFGRADMIAREDRTAIDQPQSHLYRTASGMLPAPETIGGLTERDISASLSSCRPTELAAAIHEPARADVLVAHDASALRMLILNGLAHETPWICTYKTATVAWPHAGDYGLEALIAWRGLDALVGMVGQDDPTSRAARQARMTALLLADLRHGATLNQLLMFSCAIMKPLRPAPDLADDAGWLMVPDDHLHWVARVGAAIEGDVRGRAQREIERRVQAGRAASLPFAPPVLPGWAATSRTTRS